MSLKNSSKAQWVSAQTESASSKIVTQVKQALFDGLLKPGDFLGSEKDLCQQFQVSRLPVREALGRLEAMGIVVIKAGIHGGARIAQGNLGKYSEALAIQLKLVGVTEEELFDAQSAVESLAVELVAKTASPQDISKLKAILDEAETLIEDQTGFTKKGLFFHLTLVESSGNRVLIAQMRALIDILYVSYLPWTTPAIARQVLKRHRALVAKIEQRDPQGARKVIQDHLTRVRKRALAQFKAEAQRNTELAS